MKRPSIEDVKRMPEWSVYSLTFSRVMHEIGAWSQARTEGYLQDRLRNPGFRSWFPHDPPSKELAPLLMPDDLREHLEGLPFVRLRERIMDAIDLPGDEHNSNPDTNPSYDWEAARRRVAQAVAEFRRTNGLET